MPLKMSGFNNHIPSGYFSVLIINKIYLGKFWRFTFCWNNAANKMVDLALYSKGWVEAAIVISLQPKLVIWNAQLYLHMFAIKCLPLLSTPS